jgi:hypothetical protein
VIGSGGSWGSGGVTGATVPGSGGGVGSGGRTASTATLPGTGGVVGTGGTTTSTATLPGTGGVVGKGGMTASTATSPGTGGVVGLGGTTTSTLTVPGSGGLRGSGGLTGSWPIPGTGAVPGAGGSTGAGGATGSGGATNPGSGGAAVCMGDTSSLGSLGLQAKPAVIAPGQSSTLTWYDSNATDLTIDQGIGSVAGKTSQVVAPAQTTTYTLSRPVGSAGVLQDKVTVVVTEKAFVRTGSLTTARSKHTATLLADGKVLVAGGTSAGQSAEMYDPATGSFSSAGDLVRRRTGHTATLLGNGTVLLVGGRGEGGVQASAEVYDPVAKGFALTGNPSVARESHTATLLADGKVLITGGTSGSGGLLTAELYDPATGIFSAVGSMSAARYEHAAIALASGQVLVLGGYLAPNGVSSSDGLSSAELYDPATATFTAVADMKAKRVAPVATLLPDGTALIGGGTHGFEGYIDSSSLELYDPATRTFATAGNMVVKRALFSMTLLSDGTVLIAGGLQHHTGAADGYLSNAEIYSPSTRTSVLTACMGVERASHSATLLSDGRVLVAGGRRASMDLADAQLY